MMLWNSLKSPQPGWATRSGPGSGSAWLGRVTMGCIACAFLSFIVNAQDKSSSPTPEPLPLAVLDGQPIYENQLPASEQAQLQRMLQQVYAVRRRALESVLDQ